METIAIASEIQVLAWSIVLGLFHVVLGVALATRDKGLKWNMGPRDAEGAPTSAVTERVGRALRNFLETFPFFAAAVLAAALAGRLDATTALGAQLYFWARVAYLPLYAAGVPYVRTLAWAISIAGLLMVLVALF